MKISQMWIEPANKGYHLAYVLDNKDNICTTWSDKDEIRSILLSVIDNFNEANPDYAIEYVKLIRPIPEVIID
jgi:hypothetical protein